LGRSAQLVARASFWLSLVSLLCLLISLTTAVPITRGKSACHRATSAVVSVSSTWRRWRTDRGGGNKNGRTAGGARVRPIIQRCPITVSASARRELGFYTWEALFCHKPQARAKAELTLRLLQA